MKNYLVLLITNLLSRISPISTFITRHNTYKPAQKLPPERLAALNTLFIHKEKLLRWLYEGKEAEAIMMLYKETKVNFFVAKWAVEQMEEERLAELASSSRYLDELERLISAHRQGEAIMLLERETGVDRDNATAKADYIALELRRRYIDQLVSQLPHREQIEHLLSTGKRSKAIQLLEEVGEIGAMDARDAIKDIQAAMIAIHFLEQIERFPDPEPILYLLLQGNSFYTMNACKLYRQQTGIDLQEAMRVIQSITPIMIISPRVRTIMPAPELKI
jgi:hypothetical protein